MRELKAGATPASLGLRTTAANVNRERIDQAFGREVAEQVVHLPPLEWHELETADRLLLVKLIRVQGGLPAPAELRERLVAGWRGAKERQAAEAATRAITERYHFEEKSE
jgi:hypothetical protein